MRRTFIILSVLVFFFYGRMLAQYSGSQQKALLVKRVIELNHYSPRAIDDSFSASLFRMMINSTDPRRLLFTLPEYKQLAAYSLTLDDELQKKGWSFLDLLSSLYKKALTRADSIIDAVFQKPFDFTIDESIVASREKGYNFAATSNDLYMRWRLYLKFIALRNIYRVIDGDSTKKFSIETINKYESRTREKIKTAEKGTINKALSNSEGIEKYLSILYLNAIATCFDPHTNYFSPEGRDDFQSQLSAQSLSFGFDVDENEKGAIIIERLIPGGPAWNSGELNKGDELLQLQWENKEPMDIGSLSLDDVYDILEKQTEEILILEVKKADGSLRFVALRKEKISNEENIVRSVVLKEEKKIGYILLPGFYTEWENESGSGCANDVAKEIIKLKRESIDGLVIDVRFNGGGSVQEGLEMTGIFIDEGPLAGQKESNGKVFYYRDPNRGVIYDGPLVLLVNGQTASASEMMAASLQDYHRAVIVGSNTFGKATVQQFYPLDSTYKAGKQPMPLSKEIVKITFGKFYRLDGQSPQLKGVKPDIQLPDAFDELDIGEKFLPNVLQADTIKRNAFYKPLSVLPVNELVSRSADRISASNDFQNVKKLVASRSKQGITKTETISLKWQNFEKWITQRELDLEIIEGEASNSANKLLVENNQRDKQWIESNEYEKELNKKWRESISEDIYIREAFLVLCDLIKLQKPSSKN